MFDYKYFLKNRRQTFSIIELMVVVFIVLLLMSLMTTMFVNIKMNARTAICKAQLRQVGVLFTSYETDHEGYLPNDASSDIPKPLTGNNNEFYKNWNGHLLPYIDVKLSDGYTRYAMVTKKGCTRYDPYQLGGLPNPPPTDVLKKGWIVVDDAYMKGGYQDLKAFICPEIHQNTFDVAASIAYNGIRIPRISQLNNAGFWDQAGYDFGMAGGVPTTYLANELFFGLNNNANLIRNSYRMGQIPEISEKALLIEGGLADPYGPGSNGEIAPPYYMLNNYGGYTGGAMIARFKKSVSSIHKLNFVHDNFVEFWIKNDFAAAAYGSLFDLANKFNTQFSGKAMMVAGGGLSNGSSNDYSLVSYINPENGKLFEVFFKANSTFSSLGSWDQFVDEPNDYNYLVGNMNVLFGDGAVITKDNAWLCNNRQKTANTLY